MIHDDQAAQDLELLQKYPELKDREYINSLLSAKKEKSSKKMSSKAKFQSMVRKVGRLALTRNDKQTWREIGPCSTYQDRQKTHEQLVSACWETFRREEAR